VTELENTEQIKAEAAYLANEISKFNNLNMSIESGKHYLLYADPSNERYLNFSPDLQQGMSEVGLTKEDGRRRRFLFMDKVTTDDVEFLRRYTEGIKKLYYFLRTKGWDYKIIGLAREV